MNKQGSIVLLAMLSFCSNGWSQGAGRYPAENNVPIAKSLEDRVSDLEKDVAQIKSQGKFQDFPLDKPNISSDEMKAWAQEKILEIYSYNFLNYQDVLKYIKNYFTDPGYNSYLKALDDSKNREILEQQKLIVYSIPAGAPDIIKEGNVDGIYEWDIKIPLLVSYRNDHGTIDRKLEVSMVVVRLPKSQAERGFGIHAIRAKEMTDAISLPAESVSTEVPQPAKPSSEEPSMTEAPKAVSPKVDSKTPTPGSQ